MIRLAKLSLDEKHRYYLFRRFDDGPILAWVMLNPSSADAENDDPTIRRCISFAKREGYGAIEVYNLFTQRTSDPSEVDYENINEEDQRNQFNEMMFTQAKSIVVAWGNVAKKNMQKSEMARALSGNTNLLCLGTTKSGQPRHPLYVRADQPFEQYAFPIEMNYANA